MGVRAADRLPEDQRHVKLTPDDDFHVRGIPLTLYLTSTDKSIGALLAHEIQGDEHTVYYLSRSLRGAEMNYSTIKCHCLALIFATQKLSHYFLAHPVNLVTKSNPLKYLLSRPVMSG